MIVRDMVCMWCGFHVPKQQESVMREHIRTCAKSEHVQRIAKLEAALTDISHRHDHGSGLAKIAREALR